MRRYVTLLAVVLLLIAVLAIPAAASKPIAVAGSISPEFHWDQPQEVGNRCFVNGEEAVTFGGPIAGTGLQHFWVLVHAPCSEVPGPHQMVETFAMEGTFLEGTVLDAPGTFDYSCHGVIRPDDPETFKLACNISSGTGELSGLRGHFEIDFSAQQPPFAYAGEVHFDGK